VIVYSAGHEELHLAQ